MLEVLKFIFSSGWVWAGTMCLIAVTGVSIAMVMEAARK